MCIAATNSMAELVEEAAKASDLLEYTGPTVRSRTSTLTQEIQPLGDGTAIRAFFSSLYHAQTYLQILAPG